MVNNCCSRAETKGNGDEGDDFGDEGIGLNRSIVG